ncbi:MAG: type II secretion system protein GspG [Puniceicoccales bacterium]
MGPYIENPSVLIDPWGHPYQYRCPGVHNPDSYDIWSLGEDGVFTETDAKNW